jgi:hypothetical protein
MYFFSQALFGSVNFYLVANKVDGNLKQWVIAFDRFFLRFFSLGHEKPTRGMQAGISF